MPVRWLLAHVHWTARDPYEIFRIMSSDSALDLDEEWMTWIGRKGPSWMLSCAIERLGKWLIEEVDQGRRPVLL